MKNTARFRIRSLTPSGHCAFTLMELMIVITIIAILAAITIPAVKGIIDRAQRTTAHNDALQLKNAIASYYTEYRRYPTREKGPEDAAHPVLSDQALMDILLGADDETQSGGLNPRGTAFYSGKDAHPFGGGRYRSGVHLEPGGSGTLWDPWGNHYRVVMDLDANSRVPAPTFVTTSTLLPTGIIVWSAGKDGKDDEADDNVGTW